MFKILDAKDRYTDCIRCNYMGCTWHLEKRPIMGHWIWVMDYYSTKLSPKRAWKRLILRLTALNYSKIDDIEVEGINTRDYPDFCDAYISSATYKGKPMTDKQLDRLNSDSDFVYSCVEEKLY